MKSLEPKVYTMYHSDMKIHIRRWGNSLAIRIPKKIVEHLKLTQNTEMDVELRENLLTLKKPRYTLDELMAQVTPENIHPETDTGTPVGKEVW